MPITVTSRIPQFLKQLEQEIEQAHKEVGQLILRDSQHNCPVKTGKLKGSGHIIAGRTSVIVEYTADYAISVDFRTGFLRDAYVLNERHIVDIYNRAISRALGGI